MSESRPVLIVTRPEAAARRFVADFQARFGVGWPVVIAPLMRTRWLAPALDLAGCQGLIFTSETAVRGFVRLCDRRDLHAWCVGPRTAAEAGASGFRTTTGPGDARGLAAALAETAAGLRLLWPRGADAAQDLSDLVGPRGPAIRSLIVYAQEALALNAEAQACLAGRAPVIVPFFSPRSVRLFAAASGPVSAPLYVAAISPAVASAAGALRPVRMGVAERPDSESLLDTVGKLSHLASGS